MSKTLFLDHHKELFRDELSFQKFVELIKPIDDMILVFIEGNMIGILSSETIKSYFCDKITQKLNTDPSMLEVLKTRLLSDDLVQ